MYNEDRYSKRNDWHFMYKGHELIAHARRRLEQHRADELRARQLMSEMIKDPATYHRDDVLQQVKRDIDRYSALREQFQVYCHEFARTPNADFKLALADVVFFGIIEPRAAEGGEAAGE